MDRNYYDQKMKQLEAVLEPLNRDEGEPDFYLTNICADTGNYIRYLAMHAKMIDFVNFYADDRDEQLARIFGGAKGEVWKQDNTYNHSEAWSDEMCVASAKDTDAGGDYTIAFAPHYGGDVRGNYGDFIVLTFNSFYDMLEFHDSYLAEQAYIFKLDGKEYSCQYSGSGEYFNLHELGGDFDRNSFIPEPWDEEDFIKSAREFIAKEQRQ